MFRKNRKIPQCRYGIFEVQFEGQTEARCRAGGPDSPFIPSTEAKKMAVGFFNQGYGKH
jgi:hypothetical protein